MKQLLKLVLLSTLTGISSASAVTFINTSGERVILRDFTFTHKREIYMKPFVLQNNSYYENSEIESCIADLKEDSVTLAALKPECFVDFAMEEVVSVLYPYGKTKQGVLDGRLVNHTVECMKLMQQKEMEQKNV